MKRMIIITLSAGGALLLAPLPAQAAAPKDPVRALKAKLVAGHGVRFTETTTLVDGSDKQVLQRRTGTFQFSRKGVAASDITAKGLQGMGPERVITIGKTSYLSGGLWADKLPSGKRWYRVGGLHGSGGYNGQVINPVEPGTLAALVKKGKRAGNALTGTITFKELDKVSPWFAASIPLRYHDDTKVSYRLTLSGAGLVTRVTSSYAATGVFDISAFDGKTMTIDTRFTSWGRRVSVKAPAPATVSTEVDE
ncbi:hypothetical protein Nocox_02870 [Nonomuraea coxensis DSM 45129]|uniref:Lipoprotein n=2 Tax=Nonomuraea coxensis TaxID=404386 RepID=A0ABX8TRV4_9ACTN|nr:hypothetical protein [Nonomuraea coxensis]QYC38205.1 hypothetical protein Nocox_02870 [Nonomuraea coxensis DSM 45129]